MKSRCPCHSGEPYRDCCAPLHQGAPAPDATKLMRARYSAYVLKMDDYLRSSWHESTRPNDLTKASLQGVKWLGLTVLETQNIDTCHATVAFEARFRKGNEKTQTLFENSAFLFENGHWFYVNEISA